MLMQMTENNPCLVLILILGRAVAQHVSPQNPLGSFCLFANRKPDHSLWFINCQLK